MKKKRIDIWYSQLTLWIKALRFSSMDQDTQKSLMREMVFFNNSRFVIIAVFNILLESVTMINVAFFSRSGLNSVNNFQYFSMYLILFSLSVLCLVLRHCLRKNPTRLQQCYVVLTLVWILWHATLTNIDLRHNPNILVFSTGMLGMALLVRIKPLQMFTIQVLGFLCLLCFNGGNLSNGNMINALVITVMATFIFCSRHFSMIEELNYRQKLVLQSQRSVEDKAQLHLLKMQQSALLNQIDSKLFVWDKASNHLTFKENTVLGKDDELALINWLNTEDKMNTVLLQFDNPAALLYEVELTPQINCDSEIIGAIGKISLKK